MIGSYPHFDGVKFANQIVLRSRDEALLQKVRGEVEAMIVSLKPH